LKFTTVVLAAKLKIYEPRLQILALDTTKRMGRFVSNRESPHA